jgi:Flp pilus assembly protein, pilin Flp
LRALAQDRRGGTAIEYALVAGLIALIIVTAVSELGQSVLALFSRIHF